MDSFNCCFLGRGLDSGRRFVGGRCTISEQHVRQRTGLLGDLVGNQLDLGSRREVTGRGGLDGHHQLRAGGRQAVGASEKYLVDVEHRTQVVDEDLALDDGGVVDFDFI